MKEFSWVKILGVCFTVSLIVGIIGGALTNEYFIGYIFSNFIKNQTEENSPIVKKVIEERTFVEESLIKDAFDKAIPSVIALYKNEDLAKTAVRNQTNQTGFFITTDGLVASCKKYIESQQVWYIKANDEQIYKANFIYSDPESDIAFLKVVRTEETPYFKAVDFSENPLGLSQKILILGVDAAFNQHVKSGIVSYTGAQENIKEYDEVDVSIDPELQCGPVVNLGGEVQGMAVSSNKTGTTFVIPVGYLNDIFLKYQKSN